MRDICTIEKTIEGIVGSDERLIRIEALRHESESAVRYSARAYVEHTFTLQGASHARVWIAYDGLPLILNAQSADDAIKQALGSLP
jgi:hypothetical protein